MRVLVTGSAGFVGSHMVKALRRRGIDVIEADRKTGQNLVDIAVVDAVAAERPDRIIHLASSCSTLGSINRPLETFEDTVVTAANIMDIACRNHIPVILTSSVKARDGLTPYGAAKRMVETWASECGATYDLPVVINRPGTIYGPGQEGSPESGWIAWFLRAKREGTKVTINGDGSQVRDLLHVRDYVDLMLLQMMRPADYEGTIWDVGGGEENAVTVMEIVEHLGLSYELGPERYGDARSYIGCNEVPDWKPLVHWRWSGMF